jgi:hypothetical protein
VKPKGRKKRYLWAFLDGGKLREVMEAVNEGTVSTRALREFLVSVKRFERHPYEDGCAICAAADTLERGGCCPYRFTPDEYAKESRRRSAGARDSGAISPAENGS